MPGSRTSRVSFAVAHGGSCFRLGAGKLGIVEAGVMMLKNMPHVRLDIIEAEGKE